MKLYHGSNQVIERPEFREATHPLDFGSGFYATTNYEQAKDFARKVAIWREGTPIVNIYEVDELKLNNYSILHFEKPETPWLRFVVANRAGKCPFVKEDVILGAVANDDVFRVVELFENGDLTEEEAINRFKIKKLFVQYVFKNQRVLDDVLAFEEAEHV